MARLNELADVRVFCTVARYPPLLRSRTRQGQDLARLEWFVPEVNGQYVPYPAVPMLTRPLNAYACYRRLYEAVERNGPADLILNYWLYPEGCAAVMLGKKFGVPVVVGAIGSDLCARRGFSTRHLTRWTLQNAAGVITLSDDLGQRATQMGATKSRCVTILNGCDTQRFQNRSRVDTRRTLGIQSCAEIVLFVGSLAHHKGVFDLIEAAQGVISVHPGVEFFLIGDGTDMAAVRRRVCNGPGAARIHVLGSRTTGEVALWMSAADVFCLPSHREGCPNVILEAMNCGCRVVATAVGGIPELVDSEHGTLVPPGDGRQLGAALLETLTMPRANRYANGPAGRTWDDVAAETFDVCRRAVLAYAQRQCHSSAAARRTPADPA